MNKMPQKHTSIHQNWPYDFSLNPNRRKRVFVFFKTEPNRHNNNKKVFHKRMKCVSCFSLLKFWNDRLERTLSCDTFFGVRECSLLLSQQQSIHQFYNDNFCVAIAHKRAMGAKQLTQFSVLFTLTQWSGSWHTHNYSFTLVDDDDEGWQTRNCTQRNRI